MGKYSEKTIKILFGCAIKCASPDCRDSLIFDDRGHLTVVAQIAHIRSGSPHGPRHVPGYEPVNAEENLLLLCGRHHKPVDDHESIYSIEELVTWKNRQVAESANTVRSEDQLAQIVQHVGRSLAVLTEVKLRGTPGRLDPLWCDVADHPAVGPCNHHGLGSRTGTIYGCRGRVPSRFRTYVLPEAGDRVEGE